MKERLDEMFYYFAERYSPASSGFVLQFLLTIAWSLIGSLLLIKGSR